MAIIGARAHSLAELDEVGELGLPYAEISLINPDDVEAELSDLLDRKKRHNLYYLAHFPNEGNPADLKTLRDKFIPKIKKLMDFSPVLGIKKGTMHFWMDQRWAVTDLMRAKMEMLAELVDYATNRDMTLCLENLTSQHDTFDQIFKAVPGLMMTLDIGHAQLLSEENTSFGFMDNLFDRIKHVHVHDNLGGVDVKDDLHLALGEGIVDYPKILSRLKELGYQSTITMEVKPKDMAKTLKEVKVYI